MPIADGDWAPLIPELVVEDLAASLRCWVDQLGFEVMYRRDDPPFAMLRLGRAQVMLEQRNATSWVTGPLERPYGRGINLEIEHPDPQALARRLEALGVALWRPLRRSTYVVHGVPTVQLAVLVQDPDGYLLRFAHDVAAGT